MSAKRTAEIRARLEAATDEGPWRVAEDWPDQCSNETIVASGDYAVAGCTLNEADADLIAHAPDDIAHLLEEADRLRAALGEIKALRGDPDMAGAAMQAVGIAIAALGEPTL